MKSFALIAFAVFAALPAAQARENFGPIQALYEATQALAKGDLSCQQASDCTALPIGDRACGGPQDYIVTSKSNPNMKELESLIKATTEKETDYNTNNQVFSICMFEMPPQVGCNANVCSR